MIATSHVIIGGAAAVAVSALTKNPAAGLAAGVVSHFLCDSLPHLDYPPSSKFVDGEIVWDRRLYTYEIISSSTAMILTLVLWKILDDLSFTSMFAWGAFGGYLPDLIDNFPLWRDWFHKLPFFRQFHAFHHWVHDNWRTKFPMPEHWKIGVATQIITVLPALWFLIR